jgi:hypothetical protein
MKPLLLVAITALTLDAFSSPKNYLSIEDAVRSGLLRVEFTGMNEALESDDGTLDIGGGMHNGKCIRLTAVNAGSRQLDILVETGRRLTAGDSTVQDMVITQQLAFTIPAGAQQDHLLYAMCTQMHDGSPDGSDAFALGLLAEPDLRGMAQLVERYNAQDQTGQDAIWVITDDLELTAIDGENSEMVSEMRKYAAEVTGKSLEAEPATPAYSAPQVYSGAIEFGYRVVTDSKVSLVVFDPEGNEFKTLFSEKAHRPGVYSIRYTLERATAIEPGVYTLKMFQNGRFVTFKEFQIE